MFMYLCLIQGGTNGYVLLHSIFIT